MSDAAKKKPEAEAPKEGGEAHGKEGAKGGLLSKMPVLLGGAMVIEAIVLFAGFKFLGAGAPQPAGAALVTDESGGDEAHGDGKKATDGGGHDAPAAGGHDAPAAGGHGEAGGTAAAAPIDKKKPVEIPVVEFRAQNKMSGRTFLYDLQIVALTRGEHQKKVATFMTERAGMIKDRIRTIVAQMDPEKLAGGAEPGLETLRRQIKYQLDEIVGEGVIDEVLVPKCIPIRTDF